MVLLVVTRSFPELKIENIWGNDLLKTTNSVLFSNQIHKSVVNIGTFWIHECTTWRKLMTVEESLCFTNCSVISFGCFLSKFDVLVHFCLRWERNTVNSLKTIIFSVSKPVSRWVFHNLESFDYLGGWDMWACAQIDKSSASVSSHFASVWDFTSDQGHLEWVATEKSKSFFFGQHKSREGLRRWNDFGGGFFDVFIVFFMENFGTWVGIVEESFLSWWSMTKLHSIFILKSLSQDVSRWMPESLFSFFIFKFNQTELTVSFKWSAYIPEIPLVVSFDTSFCFWV